MRRFVWWSLGLAVAGCASAPLATSLAGSIPYVAPPAGCGTGMPYVLPTPVPAGSFSYEISPQPALAADQQGVVVAGHLSRFVKGQLELGLTSTAYLPAILQRYDATLADQRRWPPPTPLAVTVPASRTALAVPDAGGCPNYVLQMNALESLDLADLPDLACQCGVSGHFTFSDRAAAALFKRSLQVKYENQDLVVSCGTNGIMEDY